jgi:hypothetical protein
VYQEGGAEAVRLYSCCRGNVRSPCFSDRRKRFEKTIPFKNVLSHTEDMGRPPLSIKVNRLARGGSAPRIFQVVPLTPQAIRKIAHRYREGGLEAALYEKPRPGAATVLDNSRKQRAIAMVCGGPPEGRARWTERLVAEEVVKRKLVPRVGRETIRILLLAHGLKPWREKDVVRGRTR